jgi:hypothetical protein
MQQIEADLGTRLEWVAVDHFNTGHPHTQVVIRGQDDQGKDLIIAQDYITDGVRLRAEERATLELGPETDHELRDKLRAEITAERFTRIDRAMTAEASDRVLDLRPEAGQAHADFDRSLRLRRLHTLGRYGLAHEIEPGLWTISEKLEPMLKELGERGEDDASGARRTRSRAQRRRLRDPSRPGRAGDRSSAGASIRASPATSSATACISSSTAPTGGCITSRPPTRRGSKTRGLAASSRSAARCRGLAPRIATSQPSRRRPASIARASTGDRRSRNHPHAGRRLRQLRHEPCPPAGGIVERLDTDHWLILADYESRAAAYDLAQSRRANLRVLSVYDLDRQITSDGATWLDHELASSNRKPLTEAGFGAEVREALERRKDSLVDPGIATRTFDGRGLAPRDLLSRLEQQEIARVGPEMAKARGLAFRPAETGNYVSGTLVGSVNLASGKFVMIEDGLGFSLVPRHPVLEPGLERHVTGIAIPDGGIDWTFGRSRGLGL